MGVSILGINIKKSILPNLDQAGTDGEFNQCGG